MSPWLHPSGGVIISDFHCMIANIIHKNNNIAKLIENLKNGCDRSNHPQLHFIYLAEANIRYAMLSFYTAVTQSGRAQTEVTPVNQSSV